MTINATDLAEQTTMLSNGAIQDDVLDELIQKFNNLRQFRRLPPTISSEYHPRPRLNFFLAEFAKLQNEFERK